ncbi:hypothetical protein C8R47DRAFT_1077398 [Mycena vitilis]|nr:hypothetical protein C8R47DRAFT_1077398 [Mycena vitilis]
MSDAVEQSTDWDMVFKTYTKPQILEVVGEVVNLTRGAKRSKAKLFEELSTFPPDKQTTIRGLALTRLGTLKRKAADARAGPSKRRRVETTPEPMGTELIGGIDVDEELLTGPFFRAPTQEVTEGVVVRLTLNAV